jgi:hypothetical protein
MTPLSTPGVRDGWHHVALTVADGATAFYFDGAPAHSSTAAGATPAAMPCFCSTAPFSGPDSAQERGLLLLPEASGGLVIPPGPESGRQIKLHAVGVGCVCGLAVFMGRTSSR